MQPLEIIAVLFALLYLYGAALKKWWCWLMGIISSFIYIFICIDIKLYPESSLQLFYIIVGFYGWYKWRTNDEHKFLSKMTGRFEILLHVIIIALTGLILGYILNKFTDSALPFLDSMISVFSIYATILTANKKTYSWIFWFIINVASVYLFYSRKLYITSILYSIYATLSIWGYLKWKKIFLSKRPFGFWN